MIVVLTQLLQCLISLFCHLYKYYLQGSKVLCFKNACSISQYLSNIMYYFNLFHCEVKHIPISQKCVWYISRWLVCHFSDPGKDFQPFHFFWKQQKCTNISVNLLGNTEKKSLPLLYLPHNLERCSSNSNTLYVNRMLVAHYFVKKKKLAALPPTISASYLND